MKKYKYLLAMLLLTVAGTSFAACPQSLSVNDTVDCIVSEAANEVQDDFKWDAVATVEIKDAQASGDDRASSFIAYDNE